MLLFISCISIRIVKDRTQVDRELGSLRRDKVLRIFKLNTGQDDYAIMFLDDYIKQIDQVFKRMEGKKEMEYEVFGWFKNYILDSKLETGIEHFFPLYFLATQIKDWFTLVVTPTRELAFQLAEQFRLTEIISDSKQPSEWHPKSHW
ncbi:hypothetical protein HN51_051798 [Arachis hypogaea]